MLFERLQGAPVDGALVYDAPAHSFVFQGWRAAGTDDDRATGLAALTIGTLQLHVGVASGRVYFVDGYHEVRSRWSSAVVRPPEPRPGVVRVHGGGELLSGVGYTFAPGGAWLTSVDEVSGWVLVADPSGPPAQDVVLVAAGTVLGLAEGRLVALWLRPSAWGEADADPSDVRWSRVSLSLTTRLRAQVARPPGLSVAFDWTNGVASRGFDSSDLLDHQLDEAARFLVTRRDEIDSVPAVTNACLLVSVTPRVPQDSLLFPRALLRELARIRCELILDTHLG